MLTWLLTAAPTPTTSAAHRPAAAAQPTSSSATSPPSSATWIPREENALVISPLTAKTHVSNTLAKLVCRDRAALVALAYECGLIAPGRAPERSRS